MLARKLTPREARVAYRALLAARRLTSRLRRLPDFIVLGAQRAGTSSLYRWLIEHPQIRRALVKEIHFFDLNYDRGSGWYRAHFPRTDRGGRPITLTGEASPYYLFHPRVPERVASSLPPVKFIVLLRDPVVRAYSHYHHERSRGLEPLAFEEALSAEEDRLGREAERLEGDPHYRSHAHQRFSYLARGRYAEQLERWFAFHDRTRFCIIASEDLFSDPVGSLARVLDFLGVRPYTLDRFPRLGQRDYAPIAADMQRRLYEYFEPHNRSLAALLGSTLPWEATKA